MNQSSEESRHSWGLVARHARGPRVHGSRGLGIGHQEPPWVASGNGLGDGPKGGCYRGERGVGVETHVAVRGEGDCRCEKT